MITTLAPCKPARRRQRAGGPRSVRRFLLVRSRGARRARPTASHHHWGGVFVALTVHTSAYRGRRGLLRWNTGIIYSSHRPARTVRATWRGRVGLAVTACGAPAASLTLREVEGMERISKTSREEPSTGWTAASMPAPTPRILQSSRRTTLGPLAVTQSRGSHHAGEILGWGRGRSSRAIPCHPEKLSDIIERSAGGSALDRQELEFVSPGLSSRTMAN